MNKAAMVWIAFMPWISIASPAQAAIPGGPCSGGTPNPMFRTIPPAPTPADAVQLQFEHQTFLAFALLAPTVTINGNTITIDQPVSDIPPPPMFPLPDCNSQTVDLGVLPAGNYQVIWNYRDVLSPFIFQSFQLPFAVTAAVPALNPAVLALLMVVLAAGGAYALRR